MPVQDHQSTYDNQFAVGYAGMIADTALCDVASRTLENAAVAFGLAVGAGAADGSCRLGGTGFEGITVADKSVESDDASSDEYAVGEIAGVMRKGTMWVTASTNVDPSDPVTFTAATGVIGAGLATTIAGAKFETTATAGNLVRVYLG